MSTFLVASSRATWREWLKANRQGRDLLVLDPQDAEHGTPARLCLVRGEKTVAWRFVGCLEPSRDPLAILAGALQLAGESGDDALVLLFEARRSPVVRQLALSIAQNLLPKEILVAEGEPFEGYGWPVGPRAVALDPAFPPLVQAAQRRARWIELLERTEAHDIAMDSVSLQGTRLGSGLPISAAELVKADLSRVLHAESFGSRLFLVADGDLEESEVARALDLAHASTATIVEPSGYEGRLCSFADQEGRDFGMGVVESIDFSRGLIRARCDAVPPAPVRILRLGALRLDESGRELGEAGPWSA